jgi:Arc/MetJ family transcription regulator
MRANIVLEDKLIREAMRFANVRTMREAVAVALKRFVQSRRQRKLLDLYGTGGLRKGYHYKRARSAS